MIKKILPVIALISASTMLVGLSNKQSTLENKETFINHFNSFKEDVATYTSIQTNNLTKTALNKYALAIDNEDLTNLLNNNLKTIEETDNKNELPTEEVDNSIDNSNQTETEITPESENNENLENLINENISNEEIEQISTLYSLSSDIEDSCGDFCELKEEISNAIIETQNLINKVQQKEIELSNEQRLFITEQAQQLKNLGRQLSNITTELSFNLSDINYILTTNNDNIDNLSLKYLVVLDNLVNGNEMLQSGLSSLNLINQMFNMNTNNIPSNNQGRILYGFKHNDNPPVVKDYYIDENGELIENSQENQINENHSTENENIEAIQENKTNIDSYKNTQLNSNLDTYNNNNLPRNIDSFFNTALLDNEFMYGNGYGGNGMYGMANPYMQNYTIYERNNTLNGIDNNYNTQNNGTIDNNSENKKQNKKEEKRFRLKKNIDTYKDENEPDIKTKLGNIRNSISGFFNKFKKTSLDDKIENPVARQNSPNDTN